VRFTREQYDAAIEALRMAREQLAPDGLCCRICHDSGHQAWGCGHNSLLAAAICEQIGQHARVLHDQIHAIEGKMNEENQDDALADWREDAHTLLHYLAGFDHEMGRRVGPAAISLPEASS
jgi:hypothetical protein